MAETTARSIVGPAHTLENPACLRESIKKRLAEIIQDYPGTEAAKEARELLDALKD